MAFNIGPTQGFMRNRELGAPRMDSGAKFQTPSRPRLERGGPSLGMGPMPMPQRPPAFSTMPMRPSIVPMNPFIGQQPVEDNQLWRTYNRLLGGQMGPRMLF